MSADFSDATRTERHDDEIEQAAELDALVNEAWDREPFDAETEHSCPMCDSSTEGTDPDAICAACERTEIEWARL